MIQAKTHRSARSAKALALGLLLAALLTASIALAASKSVHAATTFTVNVHGNDSDLNINDGVCDTVLLTAGNQCTLRAAIEEANDTEGADTINFNIPDSPLIPGPEVQSIRPTSELRITEAVTIDGYTQPGASPNTLGNGTNAVLKIQLDGSSADSEASGLLIDGANDVVVRGLVINRFDGSGIRTRAGGSSNRIEGNFIGTDPSGTLKLGNASGVLVGGDSNAIGGFTAPSQRNLISGNRFEGVNLAERSQDHLVAGNLIGTKKDGKGNLGNGRSGVFVEGSDLNAIGDSNTIAFNGGDGVRIVSGFFGATENIVFGNSIFSNAGLGINLVGGTESASGATTNDPGDPDTGPNDLQNKPSITSATTSGGTTTVKGRLNSTPGESFDLRFYSSPSGNEGKKFLSVERVTTKADGNTPFTFSFFTGQTVAAGQTVTATATHDRALGGDSTSEFSASRAVVAQ